MRYFAAAFAAILMVGCTPQSFPTPEQNAAAIEAARNDKHERIVPAVLQGKWIGDKGSGLFFGPGHHMTQSSKGKTIKGEYKMEGYKVILNEHAIGWICMRNPDTFFVAKTREDIENFRRVAS